MESKALDAALAAKNTATDGAYIMAQDASGNTIRIAKADLASVLAGLMNTDKLFPFMYMGEINSNTIDNTITQGVYRYFDKDAYDYPIMHSTSSVVLVFSIPNILKIQIAITNSDIKKLLVRAKIGTNNWGSWYTIQGT